MQDTAYVPFTEEMKAEGYTILAPNMLPMQFELVAKVTNTYGYHLEVLRGTDPRVIEIGLKYTHNDACYPALCVIGQYMEALLSGRYDVHKTALIYFQTGGGCRASNYISLIRKALKKANLEFVPVISMNFAGLEKHPGFKLTVPLLKGLAYAVLYGDLLMSLRNQVIPYEAEPGATEVVCKKWLDILGKELGSGSKVRYKDIKKRYADIIRDFAAIPMNRRKAVQVGVVGEIYVKYSPLANNHLEEFLISEGAEVTTPGLLDFMLYVVYNNVIDFKAYGTKPLIYPFIRIVYRYLCGKKNDIINLMKEEGTFRPWTPFEEVIGMADEFIAPTVKMGEGWLLTNEMMELAHSGVKNIVCTQPFGCLPNHVCGKGMMKPIKERYPDINIVAIDYDPGASRVNQENRLKLMLANARENLEKESAQEKA